MTRRCVNRRLSVLRSARRILLGCLLALSVSVAGVQPVMAWSEKGHVALTELAVRQLQQDQRRALNREIEALLEQNLNLARQTAHLKDVSALARVAAWLDTLRGLTVQEIFDRYGEKLPKALLPYASETTNDWHYSNLIYSAGGDRHCQNTETGELLRVLPKLEDASRTAEAPVDRAIALAMLVHLVGDAHQPLHMLARAEAGCQHDRGGNRFCLESAPSGDHCEHNLHRLWDAGAGLLSGRSVEAILTDLRQESERITGDSARLRELSPSEWQEEALALVKVIYATAEGRRPSKLYTADVRDVARERMALAAARLGQILNRLETRPSQ